MRPYRGILGQTVRACSQRPLSRTLWSSASTSSTFHTSVYQQILEGKGAFIQIISLTSFRHCGREIELGSQSLRGNTQWWRIVCNILAYILLFLKTWNNGPRMRFRSGSLSILAIHSTFLPFQACLECKLLPSWRRTLLQPSASHLVFWIHQTFPRTAHNSHQTVELV